MHSGGAPILITESLHIEVLIQRPRNAPESTTAKQSVLTTALIDTGASQSCIDHFLAKNRLDLVRSGEDQIYAVNGLTDCEVFHALVRVPSLNFSQIMPLYAPLIEPVQQNVLLGRDFLSDFSILYSGPDKQYSFYRATQYGGSSFVDEEG